MTPLSLEDRGQRTSIGSLKGCAPALARRLCMNDTPHKSTSVLGAAINCMSACIWECPEHIAVQIVSPESFRADR